MKKPSHNACAMIDAIKVEYEAAHKEKRNPSTSNVLAIFRDNMKPWLGEEDIVKLFDFCFNAYLALTAHPTEYCNN
jgi:hypothetical protein